MWWAVADQIRYKSFKGASPVDFYKTSGTIYALAGTTKDLLSLSAMGDNTLISKTSMDRIGWSRRKEIGMVVM